MAEKTTVALNTWYLKVINQIQQKGFHREDRVSLADKRFTFDLREGLPLLAIKPTPWKLAIKELYWFISSSYDIRDLESLGVNWWRPWTQNQQPIVTQDSFPYKKHQSAFQRIVKNLESGDNPTWNVCSLWPNNPERAILPPCATFYQVIVTGRQLNMIVHQRSADLLCGVPANLIQYAFLANYYAALANLEPAQVTFNFGDIHIYKSHLASPNFAELTSPSRAEASKTLAAVAEPARFRFTWPNNPNLSDGFDKKALDTLELSQPYYHLPTLPFEVVPVHT